MVGLGGLSDVVGSAETVFGPHHSLQGYLERLELPNQTEIQQIISMLPQERVVRV